MQTISDERTIVLTLASGDFQFIVGPHSYDASLNRREVFAAGEQVFFSCILRNNGQVDVNARIDMFDADTGVNLGFFVTPRKIPPGGDYDILVEAGGVVLIGDMPDCDWRVRFTVTP